jgi:hypothetical protein
VKSALERADGRLPKLPIAETAPALGT